jgi:GT2 family glycosyltransferase
MLVSILIPCYNAERWVAQAIESALAQTWPNKEVIVVDDGSTDGSLIEIKKFDGCIRWETGPNRGGNVARNRLLELSNGEWLQYLDADDYLLPEKVADQMTFLAAGASADVIFGPVVIEQSLQSGVRQRRLAIPEPHDVWVLLARWYLPQTGASLWSKRALLDVGAWKADQPCCQEHELYLRLLMQGKRFAFCDSSGAVYREWSKHTVCRRNQPETHRRRLQIEATAERFLFERNEMNDERLSAINQARFEIARMAWQYDASFSVEITKTILSSQPHFTPVGDAAPSHYRLIYRLFGFRSAQRLASAKRALVGGRRAWAIPQSCR